MKTIITLLSFQLRTRLKTILIWGFAMAFFMCMYMAFFSTMQEIAQVKFELLPQAYLQLMGIEDLATAGNYDQYFAMICQLLMIFVSGFAVTFSMNLILKEEKKQKHRISLFTACDTHTDLRFETSAFFGSRDLCDCADHRQRCFDGNSGR